MQVIYGNFGQERCRRISSTMLREIRKLYKDGCSIIVNMSLLHAGTFTNPKPNMYTFESSTSCKFFLPKFLSCFTKLFDNLFFTHSRKRIPLFSNTPTQVFPSFFSFFCFFILHNTSPQSKYTPLRMYCQDSKPIFYPSCCIIWLQPELRTLLLIGLGATYYLCAFCVLCG